MDEIAGEVQNRSANFRAGRSRVSFGAAGCLQTQSSEKIQNKLLNAE